MMSQKSVATFLPLNFFYCFDHIVPMVFQVFMDSFLGTLPPTFHIRFLNFLFFGQHESADRITVVAEVKITIQICKLLLRKYVLFHARFKQLICSRICQSVAISLGPFLNNMSPTICRRNINGSCNRFFISNRVVFYLRVDSSEARTKSQLAKISQQTCVLFHCCASTTCSIFRSLDKVKHILFKNLHILRES